MVEELARRHQQQRQEVHIRPRARLDGVVALLPVRRRQQWRVEVQPRPRRLLAEVEAEVVVDEVVDASE